MRPPDLEKLGAASHVKLGFHLFLLGGQNLELTGAGKHGEQAGAITAEAKRPHKRLQIIGEGRPGVRLHDAV